MAVAELLAHTRAHWLRYAATAITGAITLVFYLAWDGFMLYLDDRHITRQESVKQAQTFIQGQRDGFGYFKEQQHRNDVKSVRKELRAVRRERRRFEAYIRTDPNSKVAPARQATVDELVQVESELNEDLKGAQVDLQRYLENKE
ncbi:MAG: hypothetical protein GKS03_09585 [Alphaproteobacteria bacterium]|nr:hypothetical protein [Alphaproteobacteria bacterium]